MGNPDTTLLLAADIDTVNADMARLRNLCLAALPVALLLAAGGAWFLAGRALKPVIALTRMAEGITARGLDQRISVPIRDHEFARLIEVFNSMLDRLEKSFTQATRFSADASHELKTPLARLRLELEQAIGNAPAGSPQQEVFSSLLDEIDHLNAVSQKLLLLSLADAGRLQLTCEPVNLSRILANVAEDTEAQAPHLTVETQLAAEVVVSADAHLLEQVLQNLATNAIKFNQPDGRIRFELTTEADRVCVRVANTGPSIAPADRERLFERFYRADRSRSQRVEGVGLGLSLSREIIRAHGGAIGLENSDASLTQFLVTLPSDERAATSS
jgi:signal transduction histidine kinase